VVGQPLFVAAALQNWWRGYDRRFPHFAVEIDGRRIPNGFFTVVLNTSPYTYIGRRAVQLDAAASLEKRLVVVTFRRLTTPLLVAATVRALRAGGVGASRWIDVSREVERVRLTHAEPFPHQLDGDYVGAEREVVVEHRADALRLVHPVVVG
jgi:diacylglycerol kinase family enzyme